VLLPIDQFEEAFTVAAPDERAAFLRLLAGALDPARDLPVMVIATARSDVLEGLIEAGAPRGARLQGGGICGRGASCAILSLLWINRALLLCTSRTSS